MSSLIDAFNNFIKSLRPQEVGQLNLRSCLGCSFRKLLLKEDFCTQVQPPSKIFNPYDAQLCIYYTPETATTGQITKAERETQSSQLDLIKLINCINLIDRITLIDGITNIGNIDQIGIIKAIHYLPYGVLQNGSFETGSLYPWYLVSGTAAIFAGGNNDNYCVKFPKGVESEISQLLPPYLGKDLAIRFNAKAVNDGAGTSELDLWIWYVDGTSEGLVASNPPITYWEDYIYLPTQNKRVRRIAFKALATNVRSILLDSTFVVLRPFGIQDIRTDLKVQPEREDLLLKDVDFAANAALQLYLAAVASQKHKVYAYGYETDADGVYYFSATVNGSAFKFGRRITKGVMVQTLVHPIVCDVNTVLNFMSTTGNSKAWLQYKTES
jgi:hypothetical protein